MYVPPQKFREYRFSKKLFRKINNKQKLKISKLYTEGRRKGAYKKVLNLLAEKFPHYDFRDSFWGHINFIPQKYIKKVENKGSYNNQQTNSYLSEITRLLRLNKKSLKIVGSRSYGRNQGTDFDIEVEGIANSIKARGRIRKLVQLLQYQAITRLGIPHPRRFFYKDVIICPSFIYKRGEELLGKFKYKTGKSKLIRDEVINDTHSTFMPAFYRLKKNGFLLSYFIDHRMLLKRGDKIEFKGKEIEIESKKFKGKGFLIDSLGSWIEILSSKKSYQVPTPKYNKVAR